jgi:hypothetical protein
MKTHPSILEFPFKCKVCGRDNIEKLAMLFYYRDEGWFSLNYCSEKCFSKMRIPYLVVKPKTGLLQRLHGYRYYHEYIHNGLKYVYPVKEYMIPNNIEINPYEIFGCD